VNPFLTPALKRAARQASDWVDLQWSLLMRDLKAISPLVRGRMLDVGCGDKPYEHLFRPYVTEYIGIEHEATFGLTDASTRAGPDLTYDGRRLPFDDATFDTVMSVQVLEHTPDPQPLVDEMSRVLKPGGMMIVTAPFSFRLHEEPHDYFRYSPHGLRSMLARSGIEVIEVRAQGGLFCLLAHKMNTFLAFRVARLDGLSQQMGKLSHEQSAVKSPRFWTLPVAMPAMVALSAGGRLLDRAIPEPSEALGFLALGRKTQCPG
jgi:SAM-dependent methyltransferase